MATSRLLEDTIAVECQVDSSSESVFREALGALDVRAGHAEPADRRRCLRGGGRASAISTLYAHVRAGGVGAVVAHAWRHLYPVPAGTRAVPLVRPDDRQSIGLVWPDHRAEPLLTRALITTVREVDLVAVLDRSAASGR